MVTVIQMKRGNFQFRVMPFRLKNAPTMFQRMIKNVLGDFRFTCAVAYIDDILVHSPTPEQHATDLEAVVAALHKAGLFVNPLKCEFYKEEVTFLGNFVLKDGYAIPLNKLDVI